MPSRGDAIPTHLLTREAFDVYQRHLAAGGVIAVHVSNKYLRLVPVVRRMAEDCGLKTTRICAERRRRSPPEQQRVGAADAERGLSAGPSAQAAFSADDDQRVPLWTDQYSNLFQILSGGLGGFLRDCSSLALLVKRGWPG